MNRETKQIFKKKISEWNLKFPPTNKPIFAITPEFLTKCIVTAASPKRRAYFEILKFFPAKFIVNSLAKHNKEFYNISWDEEMWHSMIYLRFLNIHM